MKGSYLGTAKAMDKLHADVVAANKTVTHFYVWSGGGCDQSVMLMYCPRDCKRDTHFVNFFQAKKELVWDLRNRYLYARAAWRESLKATKASVEFSEDDQ